MTTLYLECVAFNAIAMSSMSPPTPLSSREEDVTLLSRGLAFNKSAAHIFISPQSGVYMFFISAVSHINDTTVLKLTCSNNLQLYPIRRMLDFYYTLASFATLIPVSRSNIIQLSIGQRVTLTSEYPTYSDRMIGTSWGAFKLDNIMYPVVAFDVSAAVSCKSEIGKINIVFDKVFLNIGSEFTSKGFFVAPVEGLYFFSTSIEITYLENNFEVNTFLVNSGQLHYCLIRYFSNYWFSNTSVDSAENSCITYLNKNEYIRMEIIYCRNNFYESRPIMSLVSLSGFLYSPINGTGAAWCVRGKILTLNDEGNMMFDEVNANLGEIFNPKSSQVNQSSFLFCAQVIE